MFELHYIYTINIWQLKNYMYIIFQVVILKIFIKKIWKSIKIFIQKL
jgi:hypothetical protein